MNEEFTFEQIELYLLGNMTATERADFEQRLQSDPVLARETEQFRTLLDGLELYDYVQLKSKINTVRSEMREQKASSLPDAKTVNMKPKNSFRWLIAAAAAIVIVAGIFWLLQQEKGSNDLTAFKPDPARIDRTIEEIKAPGFGTGDEGKRDSLVMGWELYKKFEFEQARQLVASLRDRYPEDPMVRHLLGLSLFQLAEYGKAFEILDPLSKADDFEKQDEAQFYLAYCNLQLKTKEGREAACSLFQQVVDNGDSTYNVVARQQMTLHKCG